jgi:hypothetical protein
MPQFVDEPVTVSVRRMRQINDLDFGTQADFFTRITIDEKVFDGKKFDERDDLLPGLDWTFTNTASAQAIGIKIEVFESDLGDSTRVDINPAAGVKDLNLFYNMERGTLVNRDNNQILAFNSGANVIQRGDAGDRGEIEVSISGLPGLEAQNSLLNQNFFTGQVAESGDGFGRFGGSGLATGDLNGDGKDELAIGTAENVVHVLYGSANGLTIGPGFNVPVGQSFDKNSLLGDSSPPEVNGSVAIGHANANQSFEDLLVGTKDDPIHLYSGSTSGLPSKSTSSIFFGARTPLFASAMTMADLNNDGIEDLIVGTPDYPGFSDGLGDESVRINATGTVSVNYLNRKGQFFARHLPGLLGISQEGDRYGAAVAAGDFDGDGFKELAIGIPGAVDFKNNIGAVHVVYGTPHNFFTTASGDAPDPMRDQLLVQSSFGGVPDPGDAFGEALVIADFNGDNIDDLVVGAPGNQIGLSDNAGGVFVYYGRRGSELNLSQPQQIVQSIDLGGTPPEANDRFGAALAAGDVNGDGVADLVIGAPGEDSGQGAINVLFGARGSNLSTNRSRYLKQGMPGIAGTPENGDRFGSAIAIGNFNGLGNAEIAVSAPNEDFGNVVDAGVVNIISVSSTSTFSSSIQSATKITSAQAFGSNANGLIVGNTRSNEIYTRGGHDIALGAGGNDYLNTGTSNDLLDGGSGSDTCVGGAGRDVFILRPKAGVDVIKDFRNGIDYIGLASGLEFEDLRIVERGGNSVIRNGRSTLAIFEGVSASQITATDFVPVGSTQIMGFRAPAVLV